MTKSKNITDILNSTIHSLNSVLPYPVTIDSPRLMQAPFSGHTVSVLIGITGDLKGRMIIDGEEAIYSKIGEIMFGMPIYNDMLESFAGELGNMIAGNMSTHLSKSGYIIDITTPTVIIGPTKFTGFEKAICLPAQNEMIGEIIILLILEMDL